LQGNGSSYSTDSRRAAVLANAEVSLAYRLMPAATIRGFAGLKYDSSVPGISSPSYGGDLAVATPRNAAGIFYTPETSYYAGGGVIVKFGG
jgi:hypothetical protein